MHESHVAVAAGSMRSVEDSAITFPHRWTPDGVTVDASFTGADLFHLAAAGCVLNDVYREAGRLEIALRGVRVVANGAFDTDTWRSTGVTYSVEVDTDSAAPEIAALLEVVDAVAEIPKAIRCGTTVTRAQP